tara:strand:+ start:1160 stop:1834 length:675 start_codon:yes stop_codon:yes gene_type:complete
METKIIKPKNTKLTPRQIKIVEETSIEFVNLYNKAQDVLEQFNNKRWYQFCQIGSFVSKQKERDLAFQKRELRKAIIKRKESINKSYLNDCFRASSVALHSESENINNERQEQIIKPNSSIEQVREQLSKNGINNFHEFKLFMNPPEEKAQEQKSEKAKDIQNNTLENKMKDNSKAQEQETIIQFALEYIEEKLSSKNKIWLTNHLIKLYGKSETIEELKTASK